MTMTSWVIVVAAAVVLGAFQGQLFFRRVAHPLGRFGFGLAVTGAFLAAAGLVNPELIGIDAVPGLVALALGIALGLLYRRPV